MRRLTPIAAIAALALSAPAVAANLTPDQLTQATTINNSNLLLLYPSGGPMQSVQWSVMKSLMQTALGTAYLQVTNNLSDLASPSTARTNLGLGTASLINTGTSGGAIGLLNSVNSYSAEQFFQAGSTASASINIAAGVAPTSPLNGDVWGTTTALFARLNGVTQQLGFALGFTPVNKAGDTMTGALTLNQGLAISNTVASGVRAALFETSGVLRWAALADTSVESGSNSGSNWALERFSDAGLLIDDPIFINRQSGTVFIQDGLSVTGGISGALSGNASTATKLATARTISLTGAVTATCPAFDGSANVSCTTSGGPGVAEFSEQEGSGSNSSLGSITSATWTVEPLTATVGNNIAGASLSGNQITLPAGTYQVHGYAVARAGTGAMMVARLRNVTSGATFQGEAVTFGPSTLNTVAPFQATFTIGSASTFDVNVWVGTGTLGSGGFAISTGANETYTDIQIIKVS